VLDLQQLLAQLAYLPLRFEPSSSDLPAETNHALSTTAVIDGASTGFNAVPLSAQPGTFAWRYPNVPATLTALWEPGIDSALVQGAVMAFQLDHGLDDDGTLTATFWSQLRQAVADGEVSTAPYDYLEVSVTLPETLSVWRNGTVIYRTHCNTGIPEAPTAPGSYPVYARYLSTTMVGFNPDGSSYDDPGVPDVAYFHGGDAVHGFPRSSYGFPQSLGCVELPYVAAAIVFRDDSVGTVVTIS
jgi:peptidoglycan hydrolase-like protein with peptidoglycan-binding domain